MTNDSTTKGFLRPTDAQGPLEDAALDAALQATIVGIVGLDGTLVRPRWQTSPPKQPPLTTDWCAIGIIDEDSEIHPSVVHDGSNNGSDAMYRGEDLTILASFYGPNARGNAKLLREGLYQAQNRETMREQFGFAMYDTGRVQNVPEMLENENWLKRADLQFRVRRMISRTYAVRNIDSASGTIIPDHGSSTNWSVKQG